MPKNPYIHAAAAAFYIVAIVLIMSSFTDNAVPFEILIPIAMLSLFVLSAAVMGYLFLAEPFRLYMENQKQEAIVFFGKTVAAFAGFAALFVILLLATTL